METTLSRDEIMKIMLAEQAKRAKNSKEKAKKKPEKVATPPTGESSTRVFRTVDPEDLKPSAYRSTTEDVVANSDEDGGKFEKRKDEGVGRI